MPILGSLLTSILPLEIQLSRRQVDISLTDLILPHLFVSVLSHDLNIQRHIPWYNLYSMTWDDRQLFVVLYLVELFTPLFKPPFHNYGMYSLVWFICSVFCCVVLLCSVLFCLFLFVLYFSLSFVFVCFFVCFCLVFFLVCFGFLLLF